MSSLLIMMANMSTYQYIKSLEISQKGKPEIDLILISMLFGVDIKIFYMSEEGLMKQEFNFQGNTKKLKANLFINSDGFFDIIYNKSYIKTAGICQSIILDVFYNFIKNS